MPLDGQGFEIIGLSLFGPHPVDAVHMEIDKRLTVLYGLNGSGKTTILREAESVLRGVGRGHPGGASSHLSCLHVRLTGLGNDTDTFQLSPFEESLFDSLVTSESDPDGVLPDSTRRERWRQILSEILRDDLDEEWIWDMPLLAQQKSIAFCLVPTGTPERPAWGAYLGVELSETQWGSLADYREKLREIQTRLLAEDKKAVRALWALKNPVPGWDFDQYPWTRVPSDPEARDYLRHWPKSFPVPVSALGEVFTSPVHVISDSGTIVSTRDDTNRMLVRRAKEHGEIADASTTDLNKQFSAAVSPLQESANRFLELTGPHFFGLALDLKSPSEWFVGEVPEWTATVDGQVISMGRLSGAELRWALTALQWALTGLDASRPQVFIIDEPERSLHRTRERELPQMLKNLCISSENMAVLAASHAPAFLDGVDASLHHVSRRHAYPTVLHSGTSALTSQTAETLGLSPSDLLQLTRVFLLVEGEHDEIVIQALCGDFLEAAQVKIIPMRGGRKLPGTVESQVLFDFTDAHLVAVLDNVRTEEIRAGWMEAQTRYLSGDASEAIEYLSGEFKQHKGTEYEWIVEWLSRALKKGVHERMEPYGLAARDIIEYLPVEVLVPNAGKTWDELRHEHDAAMPSLDRSKGLHEFKTWLKHAYRADTSVSNVRRAAASMTVVPEEFRKLGYHLREISSRTRDL